MHNILMSYCAVFALKVGKVRNLQEFLESLLNRLILPDETIRLTSAQIARTIMWADKNNFALELSQLRKGFMLSSLPIYPPVSDLTLVRNKGGMNTNNFDIMQLGNDIQLVQELFPQDEELDSIKLNKIFTKYEISYCNKTPEPKISLAGIFSLKESLVKAGAQYLTYLDLEITHNAMGAPIYYGFLVSISHSGEYVTSIALRKS